MTQDEIISDMAKAISGAPFPSAKSVGKAQAAISVLLPHIREMVVALEDIKLAVGIYTLGDAMTSAEQALASIPKEWRGE